MKRDDPNFIADEIYALAAKCRIAMLAACRRAGIAPSTPWRWKEKGQEPGPGQAARLRASIIVLAHERGSLPPDLLPQHKAALKMIGARTPKQRPVEIVQEIKGNLRKLEQALKGARA